MGAAAVQAIRDEGGLQQFADVNSQLKGQPILESKCYFNFYLKSASFPNVHHSAVYNSQDMEAT